MEDSILWFCTIMGTVHYWYWHSKMVPVPVLALYIGSVPVWARSITDTGIPKWCRTGTGFLHFGSVPVQAQSITGTGIPLCLYGYWQICTWNQYQYGHIPLPELELNCAHTITGISPLPELALNCARTSTGIFALWFSTSMGRFHYWY